jgi:hypothetical protein
LLYLGDKYSCFIFYGLFDYYEICNVGLLCDCISKFNAVLDNEEVNKCLSPECTATDLGLL